MPIPALDLHGFLPNGVHLCTIEEVENIFCWNECRLEIWRGGLQFLSELITRNMAYPIYIDGSFITDKKLPGDVDVVLDLTHADDFTQFLCVKMFQSERESIKARYHVDFCPNLPGNNDFSAFFQYIGPKTATIKGLNNKYRKGILRVESWQTGLNK